MLILLIFAFIAGFVTIASPCILPILPIVLSGAVGGKRKPFGVIIGFILSFTIFTLFLSLLVKAFGISADVLRYAAVVILILAGLSLILPVAKNFLSRLMSGLASKASVKQDPANNGFVAGIATGASLGLVWTPCVGPILASVISLALTGQVTGFAALIVLSFALGTALPMFGIMYGGRELLNRVGWLTNNLSSIQKVFGILMILVAFAIAFNADRKFQTYILQKFPSYGAGLTKIEDNESVKKALDNLDSKNKKMDNVKKESTSKYPKAPELIPGGKWFNSNALTLKELKGKVVLVDFWTYSCINCIRTLPYIESWHEKYSDKGLVIIGVHTPEFEFEKNPNNVKKAIDDFKLKYPVMQDNNFATWRAYSNRYWPAKYLIDKDGFVRYTHFGEGEYDKSEKMIQSLLKEADKSLIFNKPNNTSYNIYSRTPEVYLGHLRMSLLSSPEAIQKSNQATYTLPKSIIKNTFALNGPWTIASEYSAPKKDSKLLLHFESKDVFLVMRTKDGKSGSIGLKLDGKTVADGQSGKDVKNSKVTISKDRLYHLLKFEKAGSHQLEITALDDNVELFAFTFG